MRGPAVVCLVALASCTTTYHIEIDGYALHTKSRELRMRTRATVDATRYSSSDLDDPQPWRVPVTLDQPVTDREGRTRWVRDLLRGCDDDLAAAVNVDCELDRPMVRYRTHTWSKRSTARFVQYTVGAAIGGLLGGALACDAFCEEGTTAHAASRAGVYAMSVGLAAILIWGIVDCAGNWGQPGCRD